MVKHPRQGVNSAMSRKLNSLSKGGSLKTTFKNVYVPYLTWFIREKISSDFYVLTYIDFEYFIQLSKREFEKWPPLSSRWLMRKLSPGAAEGPWQSKTLTKQFCLKLWHETLKVWRETRTKSSAVITKSPSLVILRRAGRLVLILPVLLSHRKPKVNNNIQCDSVYGK